MSKNNILYKLLIIVTVCFIVACKNPKSKLDAALVQAGGHRKELEKLLDYYKQSDDTLKYKAATFLIENMSNHFYNNTYEALYPLMDSLNRSIIHTDTIYKILDSIRPFYSNTKSPIIPDISHLSAAFLKQHIDAAVEIWKNSPWHKNISFDVFCEYILPYKVRNEKREFYFDRYRGKYLNSLKTYLSESDSISLLNFCEFINERWISESKIKLYHEGLNNYPPLFLDNIRSGSCDDYGARTVFILRSLGVPVGVDFSPQWINFSRPHSWNVLIDERGKSYPFLGFDETIKDWHIESTFHCPKIFRNTFRVNPESLRERTLTKQIPGFLNSSHIKDVTDLYTPVSDVRLDLDKSRISYSKVAYLYVFNNTTWIPVHWGEIKNASVTFSKMGRGLVYLPAYYRNGKMEAASHPFILDTLGHVTPIIPNINKNITAELERKYYTIKVSQYPKRLLNGRFQGSNDPNKNIWTTLHTVKELPKITFNEVNIFEKQKFNHLRYIGGPLSFTNIAEIEFYTRKNGIDVKIDYDSIIGTDGSFGDKPDRKKENVFDGDVLTFFDALQSEGAWAGITTTQPIQISKIRYLPRNDDNNIRIGDVYELLYWGENDWISLGKQKALKERLEFKNCPYGALFLLRNHTRGKEERPFMLKEGEQIWW